VETDVQQARPLVEHGPLFQTCATEVGGPPVSHRSIALPKKPKEKYVYSKWASRRSDHKVVLKLSPKIATVPTEATNALEPNIKPTHKTETPPLPSPAQDYRMEVKLSLDVDASKIIQDLEDKNKVFK
jgi:hypothetical protein